MAKKTRPLNQRERIAVARLQGSLAQPMRRTTDDPKMLLVPRRDLELLIAMVESV